MGGRIIITSTENVPDAIAIGPDVYEVTSTLAVVCDKDGKPTKDRAGRLAVAEVFAIPAEAVELDKAADRVEAIKPRTDLPPSHPWYGYRFATACFSGDCDRVMGADGEWHAVRTQEDLDKLVAEGLARREVEPPTKPEGGDVKPAEGEGEVIRGK